VDKNHRRPHDRRYDHASTTDPLLADVITSRLCTDERNRAVLAIARATMVSILPVWIVGPDGEVHPRRRSARSRGRATRRSVRVA
jgi:hypothetical protein